jgi:hypothetical protein
MKVFSLSLFLSLDPTLITCSAAAIHSDDPFLLSLSLSLLISPSSHDLTLTTCSAAAIHSDDSLVQLPLPQQHHYIYYLYR